MFKKTKEKFKLKTQDSRENLAYLKAKLSYRIDNFLQGRKENQSIFTDNFELLLEKWGIPEATISQVCNDLMLRNWMFVFLLFKILKLKNGVKL